MPLPTPHDIHQRGMIDTRTHRRGNGDNEDSNKRPALRDFKAARDEMAKRRRDACGQVDLQSAGVSARACVCVRGLRRRESVLPVCGCQEFLLSVYAWSSLSVATSRSSIGRKGRRKGAPVHIILSSGWQEHLLLRRKSCSSVLTDLPSETLSEILADVSFLDLVQLWFCGCKRLQSKLADGGTARNVLLSFNPDFRPFAWPKIFSLFTKLESFKLSQTDTIERPQLFADQLRTLPATLTELELEVDGGLTAFQELLSASPHQFANLRTLLIAVPPRSPEKGQIPWNWPSSLVSLHLDYPSGRRPELDLSCLPPHLTSLFGQFKSVFNVSHGFPRSLTSLDIHLQLSLYLSPGLLPDSLETLAYAIEPRTPQDYGSNYENGGSLGLEHLPPHLTHLALPLVRYNIDILQILPKSLTKIYHWHSRGTIEMIRFWPPLLRCASRLMPSIITKEIALLLPRSIVEIDETIEVTAIPFLPSGIKTINYVGSEEVLYLVMKEHRTSKILPQLNRLDVVKTSLFPFNLTVDSLSYLSFRLGPLTLSVLKSLPTSLSTLNIFKGPSVEDIEHWKLLPKSLRMFGMFEAVSKTTIVPAVSSTYLPPALQVLRLDSCLYIEQKWFEGLPNTLTKLVIRVHMLAPKSDGYLFLPNTLKSLHLRLDVILEPHRARNMLRSLHERTPLLEDFRYLISKSTSLRDDSGLVDEDLALLPRRLGILSLPTAQGITHRCVNYLPKWLHIVGIDSQYNFTKFCLDPKKMEEARKSTTLKQE